MRWLIRSLGGLLVVAILATGALLAVPSERIAGVAADRLGAALGREVSLSGAVRPTLWPHLGVRAEGLRISNPEWVTEGPLMSAEALSVRVPWAAVLSGEVQIDEVMLIEPQITLVRGADGRASWALGAGDTPASANGPEQAAAGTGRSIGITAAEISGGAVTYIDAGRGQALRIAGLDARLSLPADGPAAIEGAAEVNGTALSLTATLDAPRALAAGVLSPVVATLDWPGGEGRFSGQLGPAPSLAGDLEVEASDPGLLLAILGAAMPDLPHGYGRDRLALTGHVTLTDAGTVHLRDGRLTLDETVLDLALDVTQGAERPMIRGAVSGARLVLPESTSAGTTAPRDAGRSASGWSQAPIDVSGLFAADAEIAIAVERIEGAGVTFGPVDLRATLERGRLVLDLRRVDVYGGPLAGEVVVNGRGGLSARSDVILAGVDLNPLLTDLAGYDRLEGTGSLSLQVLGVGNDMATLMASLDGQGDFAFGAGAIQGLDLAGMIRNLDPSYRGEGTQTVYDRVSANFTIVDGILSNDDLQLDASWGEVTGVGTVDIGAQTLAYRMTPGVMRDEGAARVRVPILISGPWANPTIRPDLEFMAEQELAEERERLEAEARARLDAEAERLEEEARTRANEILGTGFDAETSTEEAQDALEQRLRDEAEQQLLRLLGRGD
jgi:AsmA protein